MKKAVSKAMLRMVGWKLSLVDGVDLPECIVCMALHTSSRDFTVGKFFYTSIGCNADFLAKKEWFFFPFSLLFNWLEGIPVDRGKRMSVTDQVAKRSETSERFQLAVTLEGARKRAKGWKKGFCFITLKVNMPIMVACFDYGKKEVGTKSVFYPTGDVNKGVHMIREMYRGITACHPENFVQV